MASRRKTRPRRTVVLVDDHDELREALGELLELEGYELTGQAATGAQGLLLVRKLQPSVAVIDYELPDTNGVELAQGLARVSPATSLVLFTATQGLTLERRERAAGIVAVVSKHGPPSELLHVLCEFAPAG